MTNYDEIKPVHRRLGQRGYLWLIAALLLIFASALPAQRARPPVPSRQGMVASPPEKSLAEQANEEATFIKENVEYLLKEYVLKFKTLGPGDIQDIRQSLVDARRYHRLFKPEQRAYAYLLDAWAAFYAGEKDEALRNAASAERTASHIPDISDSLTFMLFYWQDYEQAKPILKKWQAGKFVLENTALTLKQLQPRPVQKRDGRDPNQMDPNQTAAVGPVAPLEPLSRWRRPQTKKESTQVPPRSSELPQPAASSRHADDNQPPIPQLRMYNDQRGGILALPVDFIPYDYIGKTFPKVQLRSLNGSYFYFEPGKGNILCVLLWVSERAGNRLSSESWESSYQTKPDDQSFAAAFDLDTNAKQFAELFGQYYLKTGLGITAQKIDFLGINFNPDNHISREQMTEYLMNQAMPWVNCLAQDSVNATQLADLPAASPVMLIIDTSGMICYAGPVGGVLPQMLLARELQKAVGGTAAAIPGMTPMLPPSRTAPSGQKTGMLGLLLGKSAAPAAAQPPAPPADSADHTSEQPAVAPEPAPAAVKPSSPKTSVIQAQNMLEVAYMQRRIGTIRGALGQCDQILAQWPDSIEADKARELIKSILLDNPKLREERQQQGKYVPGVGN